MNERWNWILIVAGAALILAEVALGGFAGFDLVLIGSAFVLGGALGIVLHSASTGFVIASILCVLYILVGRRWVRARFQTRHASSNVDALIGLRGRVVVRVAPHEPGQIRVRDEVWRAALAPDAAQPLEPGAEAQVQAVDGVTLLVR